MEKIESLEELFLILLSDIYYVENQLVKSIPEMQKKAISSELKESLNEHVHETQEHVVRLEEVFKILDKRPKRVLWISDMQGLFHRAMGLFDTNEPSAALDAAIIAITQRIKHFEIATYGTLCEFAKVLDYDEVKDILKETLKEELKADALLSKIAEGGMLSEGVNVKAR